MKAGHKRVDANKRPYTEALYPGKTRLARINHYQCRSFTHWMRKPARGEVGALPDDPNNAWRFSEEGCLRQFVTQFATNKNEHVDTSMLRYAEPVRRYLSQLPRADDSPKHYEGLGSASLRIQLTRALRHALVSIRLLADDIHHGPRFALLLLRGEFTRARTMIWQWRLRNMRAYARAAADANDWSEVAWRWRQVVRHLGDDRAAGAYAALCKAYFYGADLEAAEAATLRGLTEHPTDISLAMWSARIATARKHWSDAGIRWQVVLDQLESQAPADVFLQASTAYRRQGNINEAERVLRQGLVSHPADSRLAARYAKVSSEQKHRLDTIAYWESVRDELEGNAPPEVYVQISRAYRDQGNFNAAQNIIHQALSERPADIRLLSQQIEIGQARQDWHQVLEATNAAMEIVEAEPTRIIDASDFQIVCNGIMWGHGHDRLLAMLESLRRHKGDDRLLLSIEGIAYLRSSQLDLARRHWIRFWERVRDDPGFATQRAATLPHWTAAASTFFDVATRRDEPSSDLSELNFCVYTALFGEYDELRSPTYLPSGLRFICFSDRPRDVPGWEVRIVEADLPNPAMNNRRLKLLPFELRPVALHRCQPCALS